MSLEVPDIEKFRAVVDAIPFPRDATLIKALYLTVSREAELITKTCPWDLLNDKSKPYGIYLKYGIQDYQEGTKPIEKVLLITEAIAKRQKQRKKELQKELTIQEIADKLPELMREKYLKDQSSVDPLIIKAFIGQLTFKSIALPCDQKYEPWTYDLMKWIQKTGTLSFPLVRSRVWQIYRQHLSQFLKGKSRHNVRNPIRHWRISHLIEHYGFDPFEVTLVSGWTFKTSFGMMGVAASPQLDVYAHLQWKKYLPKLLKPL